MSIELEKYCLDRAIRAEKRISILEIEQQNSAAKIRELEGIQETLAGEIKQLGTDKNAYMLQITTMEIRAKDGEHRLNEFWQAANVVSKLTRGKRDIRGHEIQAALARMRNAAEAAMIDCGEIPF